MKHPLRQHIEEIIELNDDEFDFVLSHFEPMLREVFSRTPFDPSIIGEDMAN